MARRAWNKGLRVPLAARLLDAVELGEEGDCWNFTGSWRSRFGYGRISAGGHRGPGLQAHRAMYELYVGPVPEGQWLRHDCDNPLCCNPHHLRPGTAADNMRDQFEHGARRG